MELAAARAAQESIRSGSPLSQDVMKNKSSGKRKYLMVIGINTAFSSRKRRDSVRATWMPQGSDFISSFLLFLDYSYAILVAHLTLFSNDLCF